MARDEVFAKSPERASDFVFDEKVAGVFDDMLERSVPFYREQQRIIQEAARKFWTPGTRIVDLGCSLGTTLIGLAGRLPPDARFVGVDNSAPMLQRAGENAEKAGVADRIELVELDLNAAPSALPVDNASVVTMCWTLQFIRPLQRGPLMARIYDGLVTGGVLLVTEKVLTNSSTMNRIFIDFYYDFKRRNGYSEEEILRKREALENVLVPYRVDENFELFRRAGFEIVETFFQWYNFAGFLCVKSG